MITSRCRFKSRFCFGCRIRCRCLFDYVDRSGDFHALNHHRSDGVFPSYFVLALWFRDQNCISQFTGSRRQKRFHAWQRKAFKFNWIFLFRPIYSHFAFGRDRQKKNKETRAHSYLMQSSDWRTSRRLHFQMHGREKNANENVLQRNSVKTLNE